MSARLNAASPDEDLHIRRIMDEGKVFLVNLAKGRLGEDSAALLGGLLVTTGEVRMRLSRGSARNAPILFWMGAMPSARYPNVKRSNSFSRKLRTVSFFKRPTMAFRKLRSVS